MEVFFFLRQYRQEETVRLCYARDKIIQFSNADTQNGIVEHSTRTSYRFEVSKNNSGLRRDKRGGGGNKKN